MRRRTLHSMTTRSSLAELGYTYSEYVILDFCDSEKQYVYGIIDIMILIQLIFNLR